MVKTEKTPEGNYLTEKQGTTQEKDPMIEQVIVMLEILELVFMLVVCQQALPKLN